MTRNETLKAALDAVTDRGETYGKPEDVFEDVAILWSDYISKAITAFDVTQMMILLKVARAKSNPHHADNQTDIAGYAACANELMHKAEPTIPTIKEAMERRLFNSGDLFHHVNGNMYRFTGYLNNNTFALRSPHTEELRVFREVDTDCFVFITRNGQVVAARHFWEDL